MKKGLCTLLAALLLILTVFPSAMAEDAVVATVNGDPIYQSELDSAYETLSSRMEQYGFDITDEAMIETIRETALDELVSDRLLTQDMTAQGCYDMTEDEESSILAAAQVSYSNLLQEYAEYFLSYVEGQEDEQSAALTIAQNFLNTYGYTLAYVQSYYYNAMASDKYEQWLMQDEPAVTEEEIRAAYEQNVAASKEAYENDVVSFETDLANGEAGWYRPDGYRAILQIMIAAEGEDDEAKLASVREKTDDIMTRLANGEAFETLIAEYGEDSSFDNAEFLETGYQVHRDSVVWAESFVAAAFCEALQNPGDYTQPAVYGDNVHIFYYLKDVPGGAVELTDEISDALAESLLSERTNVRITERLETLRAEAEITY